MSYIQDGVIVILSSPSGAGKTTLVKKISKNKHFSISISHTTRKPRSNEVDGEHYYFVSQEEFEKLTKKDKFLEYAKVFNNYYGSSKDKVLEKLNKKQNVIFDIDWQGAKQIKNIKLNFNLISIYILPPSRTELFNRLLNREGADKSIAQERMKQFDKDLLHWKEYDYVIINDNLEKCYKEIMNYINFRLDGKNNMEFNKKFIEDHIKKLIN